MFATFIFCYGGFVYVEIYMAGLSANGGTIINF